MRGKENKAAGLQMHPRGFSMLSLRLAVCNPPGYDDVYYGEEDYVGGDNCCYVGKRNHKHVHYYIYYLQGKNKEQCTVLRQTRSEQLVVDVPFVGVEYGCVVTQPHDYDAEHVECGHNHEGIGKEKADFVVVNS